MIEYLNSKIENLEDILTELVIRRDKVVTLQQAEKEDLIKPLLDNLQSDNFEDVQESYMKNRKKRISQNSCQLENSINIGKTI